jgi:MerR family transcriptional regulator, light-induced transcriptional regulator
MRFLKTSEAAALLNVSPNTLRAWERRFGYPKPQRSPGRHRLYTYGEIASLRDALHEGLSISSAVSRAREGLTADTHSLVGALTSFELERADMAMEAALALRSLERAVEEVLLPSLDELMKRQGSDSAPWAFAAHWGVSWLRRAQRLAPPPTRPLSVVIGDATRDDLDADAAHVRAFELFCVRAGARILSLSARGIQGMGEALAHRDPSIVVIAGNHLPDDDVARWAYNVRLAAGPLPIALFRRGHHPPRVRTTGAQVLPSAALAAQSRLLDMVDEARSAPAAEPKEAPALDMPRVVRHNGGTGA